MGRGNYNDNARNRARRSRNEDDRNDNRNSNRDDKKHTGCDMRDSYTRKDGEVVNAPCIWGWNVRRSAGGLSKFVAVPAKEWETKNKRWNKMVVTITPPGMAAKFLTTGFWDTQKKRLHMPDMDMIANPKAPNGGYWGRNYRTKN